MTVTRGFLVGRFQPFHRGHEQLVQNIATEVDELVVGVGSADASHTVRNPFTAGERMVMVTQVLADIDLQQYVVPIQDVERNALWVNHIESLCPPFDVVYSNNPLVVRLFEEDGYEVREPPMIDRERFRGTYIREDILDGKQWRDRVPDPAVAAIEEIDGVARLRDIATTDDGTEA